MNEKPALIGPWPGKGRRGVLVSFGKKQSRGFTRSGSNTINWNNFLKRWPGTGKARANRWAVWIRLQPRSKGTIFNRYPFRRREDSIEQALQFRMDAKRKSIFSWIKLVFQRNIRKRLLARIARKTARWQSSSVERQLPRNWHLARSILKISTKRRFDRIVSTAVSLPAWRRSNTCRPFIV